jgi:DNA-binding transcriptional MerR regulator
MITIKGFARLCGCNTQTLRYYDRIGLLVPAKVDEWTGYRYYDEKQATRFVKIKNLQQADFSIEEIRPLLEVDDDQLMEAFERKITEQQQKLERIREIKQSYLKETMDIQKMVLMMTDFVEGRLDEPRLWQEFGLDDAEQAEISAQVHEMVADWLTQCRNASEEMAKGMDPGDRETMKTILDRLTAGSPEKEQELILSVQKDGNEGGEEVPADAEKIFGRDGWEHVSEWIDEIPDLGDGRQSYFLFRVREDSPVTDAAFPTLMLAVMATRYNAMNGGMYCNTGKSDDGLNHFTILCK